MFIKRFYEFCAEIYYTLKCKFYIYLVFADEKKFVAGNNVKLIFIPGINARWTYFYSMAEILNKKGYPMYTVPELGYNFHSIQQAANIVLDFIKKNDLRKFIIIGHSKGGLVAKYVFSMLETDRECYGTIALAAPFMGSSLANRSFISSYNELRPASEAIKSINNFKINHRIISIYPEFDEMIPEGSMLDEALMNIQVPVFGHNAMVFSKFTAEEIEKSINKLVQSFEQVLV